jgi:hypothetical protein
VRRLLLRRAAESNWPSPSGTVLPMQWLQRQWDGTPRELATWFEMRKHRKRARCAIWTHLLGWELRLTAANELIQTQVFRDQTALLDAVDEWKTRIREKGWS